MSADTTWSFDTHRHYRHNDLREAEPDPNLGMIVMKMQTNLRVLADWIVLYLIPLMNGSVKQIDIHAITRAAVVSDSWKSESADALAQAWKSNVNPNPIINYRGSIRPHVKHHQWKRLRRRIKGSNWEYVFGKCIDW